MTIKYTLSFPSPHTHYVEVMLHISELTEKELILKMAVWTPGSYLIREFSKNIDFIDIITQNQPIKRAEKIDKNTWKVAVENSDSLILKYNLYCNEFSVRTNFIDEQQALINGAATFIYVEGKENVLSEIEIIPNKKWNSISTSLPQKDANKWIRHANNLKELIDSPIQIGNHLSYFFEAENIPHEIAMVGESNCEIEKLIADLKKIITEETLIFGSHPCKNYVFIIHNTEKKFGGLEHLNSSVNHVSRWSYEPAKYQQPISLLAHEYFHLWNVKRIRPAELSTFNYNQENYTKLLWFFEGITSYYDDYICYRTGITSKDDYLDIITKNINTVFNSSGIQIQSLAESSFDTWIKYYRQNENSINAQISYYTKGSIIALLLDFIILDATEGEKSLDDVMNLLYQKYLENPEKGFSENEIKQAFETVAGQSLSKFFNDFIYGIEPIQIEDYFKLIGINLENKKKDNNIYLGLQTQYINGKLVITKLEKNHGAYDGGLNVDDEIIAIDKYRIAEDFTKIIASKKTNDKIDILISRNGILQTKTITLTADNRVNYSINYLENTSEKQYKLLKKWLHLK